VSEKHANYIVNVDHAKADDVKGLISDIQQSFDKTFGFTPEPEVVIV
jgi:UDP-N-acetylmuramate dehydrogenase